VLRPDISPELARRLGIDPTRPLTETGVANLLNARRLDGDAIDGKHLNKPMRGLVDIFGLDPEKPPIGQALENVLAGKRADGTTPLTPDGKAKSSCEHTLRVRSENRKTYFLPHNSQSREVRF
jgi:hypothetical protein